MDSSPETTKIQTVEETLLTSKSGKRLIQYTSPILQNSVFLQRVFEKIGYEFDQLHEWTTDIQLQLFPQTATWALLYWEEAYRLPIDESKDDEFRRNRILSTIQAKTQQPLTRERFTTILSSAAGDLPVELISHFDEKGQELADYTFKVIFDVLEFNPIDVELVKFVKKVIYEMKPAHLSYEFFLHVILTLSMDVSYESKMKVLQQIATQFTYNYAKQETIRFKAGFVGPGTYPFTPGSDGRYLDGSWSLDGSFFSDGENPEGMLHYVSFSEKLYTKLNQLVNTLIHLDYNHYVLLKTHVQTFFDYAYSSVEHIHVKAGFIGSGAFPFTPDSKAGYLDGSWNLNGTNATDGQNPEGMQRYIRQSEKLAVLMKHPVQTSMNYDDNHQLQITSKALTNVDVTFAKKETIHNKAGCIGSGAFPFAESYGLYIDGSWAMDGSIYLDGMNQGGVEHYIHQSDKLVMRTYIQNNLLNKEVV